MMLQGLQRLSSQATRPAAGVAARLKAAASVSRLCPPVVTAAGKIGLGVKGDPVQILARKATGRDSGALAAACTNGVSSAGPLISTTNAYSPTSWPSQPPSGPPDASWVGRAGTLEQQSDNSWRIKMADGSTQLYVDPGGVVPSLRNWLPKQQLESRYNPEALMYYPPLQLELLTPPALAVISGMDQTGKSYTQRTLLPALVAECVRDGKLEGPPPVLLELDGASLDMSAGVTARLWSLLRMLVEWATARSVPVVPHAWERAVAILATPPTQLHYNNLGLTIVGFFHGLRAPVLVLFDNFHNLLLPETIREDARLDASNHIRTVLVRQLLIKGPRNVAWNITGSCMAMVWIAIAKVPHCNFLVENPIRLPATFPEDSMRAVWRELADKHPGLDEELYSRTEPTPAMLTSLVAEWRAAQGGVEDVASFARQFAHQKLVLEAMSSWRPSLECMSVPMRIFALDLTSILYGCDAATTHRSHVLRSLLHPYVKKGACGYYLASSKHRQLIQMMVGLDGNLISTAPVSQGSGYRRLPPIQLETRECFVQMGNVISDLGMLEFKPSDTDASPAFKRAFEELAADLEKTVSHTLWLDQTWFVKARSSPYCSITAARFARMLEAETPSKSVMLAWFFRLMRHILVRQRAADGMAYAYIEDIFSSLCHTLRVDQWELVERLAAMLALMRTTSGSTCTADASQGPMSDG